MYLQHGVLRARAADHGAGEYVPVFPCGHAKFAAATSHAGNRLNQQVAQLQVYERRYAEFKLEMAALEKH